MDNLINFTEYSKNDLFDFAVDNGILDLQSTSEQMQMKEREKTLQEHNRSIWQGTDGRWRTKLKVDGKYKIVCRVNRTDLENEIIKHRKLEEYNPTIEELYNTWVQDKVDNGDITENTKDRYDRQFAQCMSEFGRRKVRRLEADELEEHIIIEIHDKQLTQKGFSNLRTILYGIFRKAKKKKLIDWNITEVMKEMDISKNSFREIEHEDDELVFTDEEKEKITVAIEDWGYDSINLAILLLFKTGCRPGEITALTNTNLRLDSVKIDRTEVEKHDKTGTTYIVKLKPKTKAGKREFPVGENAEWLMRRIMFLNPGGEYVFVKNGKRINQRQLRQRLITLCKRVEITPKSPNKVRKTVASLLLDEGVEKTIVKKVMGHADIATTEKYYHKNRFSDAEIAAKIKAVNL